MVSSYDLIFADNLNELNAKFEKATSDKLQCEEEAMATQETIVLANRLVNGLAR
jgi:dynein heavy chain